MILKIHVGTGWVVYDGFDKVHYRHLPMEELKQFDVDATWWEDKEPNRNTHGILITARKRHPDEKRLSLDFAIRTNSCVYLCNDKGETIERIN